MKTIEQWFKEYGESHTHPVNVAIHKVAVPAIVFSILAILWQVRLPFLDINLAIFLGVTVLIYYSFLSVKLSLAMLVELALMYLLLSYLEHNLPTLILWQLGLLIFIIAWVFQFIGHKIEGKKPSFFQDILFLLIGPLWTLNFLLRSLGITR